MQEYPPTLVQFSARSCSLASTVNVIVFEAYSQCLARPRRAPSSWLRCPPGTLFQLPPTSSPPTMSPHEPRPLTPLLSPCTHPVLFFPPGRDSSYLPLPPEAHAHFSPTSTYSTDLLASKCFPFSKVHYINFCY